MTTRFAFLTLALWSLAAAPLHAQSAPEEGARNAALALEAAVSNLGKAGSTNEQIAALTQTVQIYEAGLSALREGLRIISTQKAEISAEFGEQASGIGDVLATMGAISRAPAELQMLHPTGSLGTVRAAMLMAELTPALTEKASVLRERLRRFSVIEEQQKVAIATLEEGLARVHDARQALAAAVSNRTDLPQRFEESAEGRAVLLASATSLTDFAEGLNATVGTELIDWESDAWNQMGKLALPVSNADILLHYNQADATGMKRPGLTLATAPQSIVTSPITATIRYLGPLLDLGTVIILEPAPSVLFVFAGLAEAYGKVGQILPAGTPIGIMGGSLPDPAALLAATDLNPALPRKETLYLEVREGKSTADPAAWFALP